MQTISIIEILFLFTIVAMAYDLYQIYSFHLPHYKKGLLLSNGNSPYPGRAEFPSNYKMEYKSEHIVYKFISPTFLVFRYNYDFGKFQNLMILKGVGELKNGEIILSTRFGLITPISIILLLIAHIILLGRAPDIQEMVGIIIALFLVASYFFYCRKAAWDLPKIVAEKIDESLLH